MLKFSSVPNSTHDPSRNEPLLCPSDNVSALVAANQMVPLSLSLERVNATLTASVASNRSATMLSACQIYWNDLFVPDTWRLEHGIPSAHTERA
jgi:hypothetical protein